MDARQVAVGERGVGDGERVSVAHEGGGGGEVAADGREVEGGDRVDEALERTILGLVPHARARERLLGVELLRVGRVEAPEVDELAGGVDLGLEDGLGLPEHGGRVQGGPPRGGQQVRRLQEHRGPVFPGAARPLAMGLRGGVDRLGDVLS